MFLGRVFPFSHSSISVLVCSYFLGLGSAQAQLPNCNSLLFDRGETFYFSDLLARALFLPQFRVRTTVPFDPGLGYRHKEITATSSGREIGDYLISVPGRMVALDPRLPLPTLIRLDSEPTRRDSFVLNETLMRGLARPWNMTAFGRIFKDKMQGAVVYDLGAGIPEVSIVARAISQTFGADHYIGVDHNLAEARQTKAGEFRRLSDHEFTSIFLKDDILTFLSSLNPHQRLKQVFILSGIESVLDETGLPFLAKIQNELQRVTRAGDMIVLVKTIEGFQLENYGFKNEGKKGFVQVFEKKP